MQSKLAKDIVVGDKIIVDRTGDVVAVTRSEKGFATNSKLLIWRGGWACVPNYELREIAN